MTSKNHFLKFFIWHSNENFLNVIFVQKVVFFSIFTRIFGQKDKMTFSRVIHLSTKKNFGQNANSLTYALRELVVVTVRPTKKPLIFGFQFLTYQEGT